MMLQTVSDGTATALRDVPGLGGKTGTAEFGDNTHSHGWFAGIAGDIAFATLVVGGDTSAPAITRVGRLPAPGVDSGLSKARESTSAAVDSPASCAASRPGNRLANSDIRAASSPRGRHRACG